MGSERMSLPGDRTDIVALSSDPQEHLFAAGAIQAYLNAQARQKVRYVGTEGASAFSQAIAAAVRTHAGSRSRLLAALVMDGGVAAREVALCALYARLLGAPRVGVCSSRVPQLDGKFDFVRVAGIEEKYGEHTDTVPEFIESALGDRAQFQGKNKPEHWDIDDTSYKTALKDGLANPVRSEGKPVLGDAGIFFESIARRIFDKISCRLSPHQEQHQVSLRLSVEIPLHGTPVGHQVFDMARHQGAGSSIAGQFESSLAATGSANQVAAFVEELTRRVLGGRVEYSW